MKRIFAIAVIALSLNSIAQNNCNITLTADTSHVFHSGVGMSYLGAPSIAPIIDTTQWHYMAITKASNLHGQIYLDGQLIVDTLFYNLSYNYSTLYLAASYFSSFGGYFNGHIDEFRMSNTIRTTAEVQSYYSSNLPFTTDANTIDLWHFDETNGSTIFANVSSATNGTLINNPQFTAGKFGNAIYFNGINQYGNCNISIPSSNITFEFWFKTNSLINNTTIIQPYGGYSSNISYFSQNNSPSIQWSTGATTPSITINPTTNPIVWVNNGTCTDTIYFGQVSATVYDTLHIHDTTHILIHDTTHIAVTDTLIINANLTGINPPNNIETIKVFPNPAHDHIYINVGNNALMSGYSIKIINSLSQIVYVNSITTSSQYYVDLSTWTGQGTYFVYIIDSLNNIIDIKKIIIQ